MSGFEFIFVGSFTLESIKPMIETYLGSLLSTNTVENWKDLGIRPVQGPVDQKVFKGTDPKSFVDIYMDGPADWYRDDAHLFWSLSNTLERIYIDKLREEMSGVYGLAVRGSIEKVPYQHYKMEIVIPCSPENTEKLTNAALAEINRIKEKGLTPGELEKEKESQIRSDEKDAKDNNAWLWKLEMIYKTGEDFTRLSNPALLTNKVTSENIQRIAKYLNTEKCIKITLYPEKSK
jgi:zinc protease